MTFSKIERVSISTIDRIHRHNHVCMKPVYRVPQEELRFFVHEFILVDEAGFNLTKRSTIGKHALVEVPGQPGGIVILCAATSNHGLLHRHATLGPYNTQLLPTFPDGLRDALFQHAHREVQTCYVVVWDNVLFHHAVLVQNDSGS